MWFKDVCKAARIRQYFLCAGMTCFFSQRNSRKYILLGYSKEDK